MGRVGSGSFFDGEPEEPTVTEPVRTRRSRRSFWREIPVLIVVALLLSFAVQTFLARVYVIPSASMEPTLHGCVGCSNDRILVDKISYHFTEPRAGDVVVFRGPDSWTRDLAPASADNAVLGGLRKLGAVIGLAPPDERDFVKRIIATSGQTVECCDAQGSVLVDGVALDEPYLVNDFSFVPGELSCTTQLRSGRCFDPVTVPAVSVWVMGDNRSNSADSRIHGAVPVAQIIGKARLIVLPVSRWQLVNAPTIGRSSASP